ncbi:glycosyl transferase family 2 [Isoptericola sp. CG 20/1183]|uniref:Glycosyl transferase family 2 n=1 Tax=Isoptericola halotolerans TaxID=300560 RepID=A0ABX5EEJ9_9MICO|nr:MULTISPECIES: glycosyltransferase family A protein [Isoptericola]PRZ06418.1 glycosyl transferase family 2 [Isoptericola halotolerans]PRZ06776.1 glycosyl transferase family 2 [Isoptericola sp. CG 20/1183]
MVARRVTVVMSTNRVSPYLPEALQSLKDQSFPDWELIVMDNGSPDPDGVRDAVSAVPGAEVVPEAGHGVSIPLNHGAALARGEFLTFLDDDDVWLPDRLERFVTALDAAPDAGAAYSSVDFIDSRGQRGEPLFVAADETRRDLLAGRYPFPNVVSVMYRRTQFLRVGGFNPALHYAEDTDLTFRMLQYSRMVAVPEVLTLYRRHEQNVTRVLPTELHDASRRMIGMQLWGAEHHPDPGVLEDVRANLDALDARDSADSVGVGLDRLRRGQVVGAGRMFTRAVRLDAPVAVREVTRRVGNRLRRPAAS